MWLMVLLTYCVLCWLAGCLLVRLCGRWSFEVEAQTGVSAAYLEWTFVLAAPVAMPFVLWAMIVGHVHYFRYRATLRWAQRTVREYQFIKVNSLHVEEPVRDLWQQHTPALFQLGFELLGDYQMKPEPVQVHDRIFLSDDGQTIGDICALLGGGAVSFVSVLSDGTVVHTCSSTNPRPKRTVIPADQLWISYLPDVSMEELHRHHIAALGERSTATGTRVLRLSAEQLRPMLVYDQNIFNRWRYRHGDLPRKPAEPDFSTLSQSSA
jgi:hypothetical protein